MFFLVLCKYLPSVVLLTQAHLWSASEIMALYCHPVKQQLLSQCRKLKWQEMSINITDACPHSHILRLTNCFLGMHSISLASGIHCLCRLMPQSIEEEIINRMKITHTHAHTHICWECVLLYIYIHVHICCIVCYLDI